MIKPKCIITEIIIKSIKKKTDGLNTKQAPISNLNLN